VTEAFLETQHTGQGVELEQARNKQAENKKQETQQIEYVLVALDNRKGHTSDHAEEHPEDGIGDYQAKDKKKSNKNGFFLRLGRPGDETQSDGDPHDCAGAHRGQGAGPKDQKQRQKRRIFNHFLNTRNHSIPHRQITKQFNLFSVTVFSD